MGNETAKGPGRVGLLALMAGSVTPMQSESQYGHSTQGVVLEGVERDVGGSAALLDTLASTMKPVALARRRPARPR